MPKQVMVLDSSPLVALATAGVLERVLGSGEKVLITPEVDSEVVADGHRKGFPDADVVKHLLQKGKISIVKAHRSTSMRRLLENPRLSRADATSLSLAIEKGARLNADDSDLRFAARSMGIALGWSLSLLAAAVDSGVMTREEAVAAVDRKIAAGWYCPTLLYNGFVHRIVD